MRSINKAISFVQAALASGPRKATDVEQEAANQEISRTTLKRARRALGVKSRKVGGRNCPQHWIWEIAAPPKDEEGQSLLAPQSRV